MDTIGIDFGTSNSIAARSCGGVVRFANFPDGQSTNPTILYFPSDRKDFFIGNEGIETYFQDLENGKSGGRLMFSIKTLLADAKFDHTLVHKHGQLTAAELCGHFLLKLKLRAENHFNSKFKRVILGRPVDFSEAAISRLSDAAKFAGFKTVEFVLEPLAAVATYESKSASGELVFVIDLGGGTSDMCVVEVSRKIRWN